MPEMILLLLLVVLVPLALLFEGTVIRILSALHIVKGVLLRDMDGDTYVTFERKSPWDGRKFANVHPLTRVGSVMLEVDGTVSGSSSYIKEWKYL